MSTLEQASHETSYRARVSVIIPSYNCADTLGKAIDSVLAQSFTRWELIVIDDGSSDNTAEVVAPYLRDARIRRVFQQNRGLPASRNAGARLSQAEYLAFLDADDELPASALEKMTAALDRSAASWCLVDTLRVNGEVREVRHTEIPAGDLLDGMLKQDFVRRGMFFRREDFLAAGMYDESMRYHEDWDLNIRMFEARCRFTYLAEPLYIYIWRPGSLITQNARMLFYSERVLRKHHKRLADSGDRQAGKLYANALWDLSRKYFYRTRNVKRALACAIESLRYDFDLRKLLHPLFFNFTQLTRKAAQ